MNAAECRQLGETHLESPKNHCHSGQYFSLVGEGKKNVFPLLACSILDLQVATACAHTRLALGAPSLVPDWYVLLSGGCRAPCRLSQR